MGSTWRRSAGGSAPGCGHCGRRVGRARIGRYLRSRREKQVRGPLILMGNPTLAERADSGARRAEVRRILGGRRRADPAGRRAHRRNQEAGQRRRRGGLRDGRHHRRAARPGPAGLPGAPAARARHAADRRRADLQRPGRHGHRVTGRARPLVHRIAGRRHHHRHPRQRQDHRRHPGPAAHRPRRGPDRAGRRLPGRQPGQQGRHHPGPRRLGHHRGRAGGRPARPTSARSTPMSTASSPPTPGSCPTPVGWTPSVSRRCSRWRRPAPRC